MDFKTLFAQLSAFFLKLNRNQKIVIALTTVAVVAFLVFLMIYSTGRSKQEGYKVLFDNLTSSDAALVIEQLKKDGIEYKLGENNVIEVPQEVVYQERINIASLGIPKDSEVGFELFDNQEFGATSFDQQVKFLRALEGELSRTISALGPIEKATVHLALPKKSVFVSKDIKPTASVVIELQNNRVLSRKQIAGIKNLVASAVTELSSELVSVVNSEGETLGDDDSVTESDEMAKIQMRYRAKMERAYEEKIVKVLAPFIGSTERVVAKVTINFDFSQKHSTQEVFDPENVVRSEQLLEEKREGFKPKEVGGVPGAVSNIGPVEGLADRETKEKYEKNTQTTNYEISKTTSNIKGEFATIRRITAAVVVDGRYENEKGADGIVTGNMVYVALEESEIDAISSLVRQSIGINNQRGDEVTVTNFQFKATKDMMRAPGEYEYLVQTMERYLGPATPIFKYFIVFLLLFIMYKKMVVPFSERMLEVTKAEEEIDTPILDFGDEEDDDLLDKVNEMRKKVENQLGLGENFNEDEMKYEVLIEKLRAIADEKPEEVAVLLSTLLQNENQMQESASGGKGF